MDFERSLKETVEESFTQYAGAVIQSRALVDVRDCVKPSARQIYYCLYTDGFTADKPFKKTLKAIGSSMRLYIHGDSSCEGIIMRSGQPFSYRYPLVEVEGSYGNQTETGNWAASRYTASRLSPLTNYLVQDTSKYSIDEWIDNYDDTEKYPRVFSSLGFYNIVNGSFGIAVGLAGSIPQFNLVEVNDSLIKLLNNPDINEDEIICLPDFATGGTIINKDEVIRSLRKGTGKPAIIQAKIDYDKKDHCLIVSELPYGVYTNTVCNELEKLAQKDDDFPIVRINDLTGESVCIKLYLAKNADLENVIDFLYQNTSLQSSYGINMTMLKDGRFPKVYGWKEALTEHLRHEELVYTKCFTRQLEETCYKLKITEGIIKAIQKIDSVIDAIQKADSSKQAASNLQELLDIDSDQAKAILDMKLSRLTKLEVDDYVAKREALESERGRISKILDNKALLHKEMVKRFKEVKRKFGDDRRTVVVNRKVCKQSKQDAKKEPQQVVITYTTNGYIKSTPISKYREVDGNLGGIKMMTDDYVQIYNSTKVYRLKVGNIKQCLASEKGTAIGVILGTGLMKINHICACGSAQDLVAVSKSGRIKRFESSLFDGTTQNIKGQDFFPKNEVESISPYAKYVVLKANGRTLSADISKLKSSGKASTGRIAIKLSDGEVVDDVSIINKEPDGLASLGTRGS